MPTVFGYLATLVVIAVLVGAILLYHLDLDRRYRRARGRPAPGEPPRGAPAPPASAPTAPRAERRGPGA